MQPIALVALLNDARFCSKKHDNIDSAHVFPYSHTVRIMYTTRAVKQLAKLTRQHREAIEKSCAVLESWPSQYADVKKLKNRPDWRLRVGRFRVIFEINEEDAVIVITQVVIRDDRTY